MKLGSARVTHACVAALAFLFVLTPLLAEDATKPPPKQPSANDARLEQLEAQLRNLAKKVNELQNAGAKTQTPADSSAPKSTTAPATSFEPKWLQSLTWRSIGPAGMGGR